MVSDPQLQTPWLGGKVLVASPELDDLNFHKTLIYLVQHNKDGAFGFVINRPSEVEITKILAGKSFPDNMSQINVYNGGPVETDRLLLGCFTEKQDSSQLACKMIGSLDEASESVQQEGTRVMGFLGCAGWQKGQLESELQLGSWTITHLHLEMLNPDYAYGIWALAKEEDDRWKRLIPYLPFDPMQN